MKVKGGKAKVIVNQYASSLDRKIVWKKFREHCENNSIVSMNKDMFFEKLSNLHLTDTYKGGAQRFLDDFENTVSEIQMSTYQNMKDSDLVSFQTTALSLYNLFSSIKPSLDTNALINKQKIAYDGMIHVLYSNCPQQEKRMVNTTEKHKYNGGSPDKDTDNAWKKDFTKWALIKIFKELPESEQKARKEAQSKAKTECEIKKVEKTDNDTPPTSDDSSSDSSATMSAKDLKPTFREIM